MEQDSNVTAAREAESPSTAGEQANVPIEEVHANDDCREDGANTTEQVTGSTQHDIKMDVHDDDHVQTNPTAAAVDDAANNNNGEPGECASIALTEQAAPPAAEETITPTTEKNTIHVHTERQSVGHKTVKKRIASTQPARRSIRIIHQSYVLKPAEAQSVVPPAACISREEGSNETCTMPNECADTTTTTSVAATGSAHTLSTMPRNRAYHTNAAQRRRRQRIAVSPTATTVEAEDQQQPPPPHEEHEKEEEDAPHEARGAHTRKSREPTRPSGTRMTAAAVQNHTMKLLHKHTADLAVSRERRTRRRPSSAAATAGDNHVVAAAATTTTTNKKSSSTRATTAALPHSRTHRPVRRIRPPPAVSNSPDTASPPPMTVAQKHQQQRRRVLDPDGSLVAQLRKFAASSSSESMFGTHLSALPVKLKPAEDDIIAMPASLESALMACYERGLGQMTTEQRETLVGALVAGVDARAEVLNYMRLRFRRLQQHREQERRILMAELGVKAQTATQIARAHNFACEAVTTEVVTVKTSEARHRPALASGVTVLQAQDAHVTLPPSCAGHDEDTLGGADAAGEAKECVPHNDSTPEPAAADDAEPSSASKAAAAAATSSSSAALTRSPRRTSTSLSHSVSHHRLRSMTHPTRPSTGVVSEYTVPHYVVAELKEHRSPDEPVLGGTRPQSVTLVKPKARRHLTELSHKSRASAAAAASAAKEAAPAAPRCTPLERFRVAFATEVRAIFYEDCLAACVAVMPSWRAGATQRRAEKSPSAAPASQEECRALCEAALQNLVRERTGWARRHAQRYAAPLYQSLQSRWLGAVDAGDAEAVSTDKEAVPMSAEAENVHEACEQDFVVRVPSETAQSSPVHEDEQVVEASVTAELVPQGDVAGVRYDEMNTHKVIL